MNVINSVWGDRVKILSLNDLPVLYTDVVSVECCEHLVKFTQSFTSLTRGIVQCPVCKADNLKKKRNLNKALAEIKLSNYQNGNFTLIDDSYTSDGCKCNILCNSHNIIMKSSVNLILSGSGCIECGIDKNRGVSRGIKENVAFYVDVKKYDYINLPDLSNPCISIDMITFKCKKHKCLVNVKFRNHKSLLDSNGGCPLCRNEAISRTLGGGKTPMQKLHEKYPSASFRKHTTSSTEVFCEDCGETTIANTKNLLKGRCEYGSACKRCNLSSRGMSQQTTWEQFKHQSKEMHPDLEIRLVGEWVGIGLSKIELKCKDDSHGWLPQGARDHIHQSRGCAKCSSSKQDSVAELEVLSFIKSLGVDVVIRDRKTLNGLELDILIPSKNIAIEFNGLYYHSIEKGKDKNYHANKTNLCKSKGIRLIHVWEDDWRLKPEIIKSILKMAVGKFDHKHYARKTRVIQLEHQTSAEFLNEYHIQGEVRATTHLALIDWEDSIVAVMTFTKRGNSCELSRFGSKGVVGGFSKLLKHFENNYSYDEIVSFCDLSMFTGESYLTVGFELDKINPPDYKYIYRNKRVHKFNYRKDRIAKKHPDIYNSSKTEAEMTKELKLNKIYDCGKARFIKKPSVKRA